MSISHEKSEEIGSATKKSLDTLRATEKLADAIYADDEEQENWEVYEEAKRTGVSGILEPIPGPYFQTVSRGKTPADLLEYILTNSCC